MKIINRTVWVLSAVSLCADLASEMLYPVVPVYLREIGFSVLLIGILEGLAEATAGLSKGYFGKRSDEKGVRLPFIKWGYALSAFSKPMMALAAWAPWIFLARTTDRLGKGLRTAPRDALLSANATDATRARVFGFHRAMDTLGGVIGPLVALLLLQAFPGQYALLFYLALLPGLAALALLFLLREKKRASAAPRTGHFLAFLGYWRVAPRDYRRLVSGLLLFALFNSSDVFLLLKIKELTGSDAATIGTYIFYNLVFALAAYPMGALADRLGFKTIFLTGMLLFSVVYLLCGIAPSWPFFILAFFLYGLYAAATEGIAKAWMGNLVAPGEMATAVGFYSGCQSICALLASSIAGAVWYFVGPSATFIMSSAAALFLFAYMYAFTRARPAAG